MLRAKPAELKALWQDAVLAIDRALTEYHGRLSAF